MKIAIIGAGFTGLAAAYRLVKNGHDVTVFERDSQPGGLAVGYQEKGWEWTLEAFYHHWFTNDNSVLDLAKELNYPVIIKRPKTSHLIDGKIYHLDSPATLLKFEKLTFAERLQMGIVLALLRYNPLWKPLEKITAHDFLSATIGTRAYRSMWEPLLVGKFGKYYKDISLAWFWARITKRTTNLAYPEGGFLRFAEFLDTQIRKKGGKIFYNTEIAELRSDGRPEIKLVGKSRQYGGQAKVNPFDKLRTISQKSKFDRVIVTLPSFGFLKIAPDLPDDYKKSLMKLQGLGAVCVVMRLKKQFFKDNTYWLSVCDTSAPVLAVVEHTNLMDKSHYNGEHLVYLGHYIPAGHKYFEMSDAELMKAFDPFLKTLSPDYKKNLIGFKKFAVPFAQPIVLRNYSKMIPALETPLPNVFLANMQQVYPWDRGTNYAVELGERAAEVVV